MKQMQRLILLFLFLFLFSVFRGIADTTPDPKIINSNPNRLMGSASQITPTTLPQSSQDHAGDGFFKSLFKNDQFTNPKNIPLDAVHFGQAWKTSKLNGTLTFLGEFFSELSSSLDFLNTLGLGEFNKKLGKEVLKFGKNILKHLGADNPHGVVGYLYSLASDNFGVYYCAQKFQGKLLFDENNNLLSSGRQYPSFNGRNFAYVYGRRIVRVYDNDDHYPFTTDYREPDGTKPRWFPGPNGPLGYLYKISWNFAHPFTKQQIDEMSPEEKDAWGLNDDGTIYYQVVLEVGGKNYRTLSKNKRFLYSKVRAIPPGGSSSGTISFYNLLYFTKVYLKFVDFDEKGKDVGQAFRYKKESSTFPPKAQRDAIPLVSDKPIIGGFYEVIPGESFDYSFAIENIPYSYADDETFVAGQPTQGNFPGTPNYDGAVTNPTGLNEGSSQAQGDLGW